MGALQSIGLLPGLKVEPSSVQTPLVQTRIQSPVPAASSWASVSIDEPEMAAVGGVSAARKSASPTQPAVQRTVSSAATATADPDSTSPDDSASQQGDPSGFDLHPAAFLGKGANHDPFMISERSQREVVKSLAWKSALCIWSGPALTTACLYFLALTLGWL